MLTKLKIENFLLIEQAVIPFSPHLNIITGETGSGKSALLAAIRLILAERADSSWIGPFQEKSAIEAHFEDGTCIRRELHSKGSRLFLNGKSASQTEIKAFLNEKVELISQGSPLLLKNDSFQRELFDSFAEVHPLKAELKKALQEQMKLKVQERELLEIKEKSDFEKGWIEQELSLLEESDWEKEESLQQEYDHLNTLEKKREKVAAVLENLYTEDSPFFGIVKRALHSLEALVRLDASLENALRSFKSAALEWEEVVRSVERYQDQLEMNPNRWMEIEKKLEKIHQVHKKFGKEKESILEKRASLEKRLKRILEMDEEEKELLQKRAFLNQKVTELARTISEQREKAQARFVSLVEKELHDLNLEGARFEVRFFPKNISENGQEEVLFFFSANLGFFPEPLSACASGGELSRLFLAIKLSLKEKETPRTLIFDEIDSNVGGRSATILAEKLLSLSKKDQVIAVTHFVQVAKKANWHLLVQKRNALGKTVTEIFSLNSAMKEQEFERMVGALP